MIFFKLSLRKEQYDYCIKNNVIAVDCGIANFDVFCSMEQELETYVMVTLDNLNVAAVVKIKSSYEFKRDEEYPHQYSVEWLCSDVRFPALALYEKPFRNGSFYKLATYLLQNPIISIIGLHKQNPENQFTLLSPDGFPLSREDEFYDDENALIAAVEKWKERFLAQGYYSSPRKGRIPYDEIERELSILEIDKDENLVRTIEFFHVLNFKNQEFKKNKTKGL